MKTRIFTFITILCSGFTALQAQENPKDEGNNSSHSVFDIINVNILQQKNKQKQHYPFSGHMPLFYLAFARLTNHPSIGLSGHVEGISERTNRSYEWGMYLFKNSIPIIEKAYTRLGLVSALGFSQNIHYFNKQDQLIYDVTDGNTGIVHTDKPYGRTWLNQFNFRLPFVLELQLLNKWQKPFFISFGPEFEYRSSIRTRGTLNGEKETIQSDFATNRIGVSLLFQAGFNSWGIIARSGLTPLFSKSKPSDVYNSMITFFYYL